MLMEVVLQGRFKIQSIPKWLTHHACKLQFNTSDSADNHLLFLPHETVEVAICPTICTMWCQNTVNVF